MAAVPGTRESRGAALFFSVVALGCGYIVAAKLHGLPPAWVTFVPVGIMVGYALLIGTARGLRLRDDQSGDNLYYLGFLYTLTSLGVSLFQFSTRDVAADRIVQNFGVAIATTIAGVALRIVFNQMRRDPVEIERIARLELADAARRVRRELDATVVELAHSRRATQQVVFEGLDEVARKVDDVAKRIALSLDDLSRQASQTVGSTAGALAREVGALSEGVNRIVTAMEPRADAPQDTARALGPTIEELSRRLADVARQIEARDRPAEGGGEENSAGHDAATPGGGGNVVRLGTGSGRVHEEGA